MTEYILLVIVSSLIGLLVPGANDGIKKTVRFLCGLVLLIALAVPIVKTAEELLSLPNRFLSLILPNTEEFENMEGTAEKWVVKYSARNIEMGVSKLIENRYGAASGSVHAEALTEKDEEGNLILSRLSVYIGKELSSYAGEIARYVSDMLACPCDVVIRE